MQKQQLVEMIKRSLAGGDSEPSIRGRYHEKEIELALNFAFDSLLNKNATQKQQLADELGLDSWKFDALTKPYVLDILKDEARNRYYSVLPISVLSITNNAGIRMITPTQEESTVFFPRRQVDTFLMNGLDVNQLTGMIYFSLEGNKIWYSGDIDNCWKTVLAKLVLEFSEFEDDDDINIPDGKDYELMALVIQWFQQKNPQDIVDDSIVQQTTK